jgi:hypothetical protein
MKVYIKIHKRSGIETVAVCDEHLLDKVFKEGKLRIEVSRQFFGGKLINVEEAIEILKSSSYFNIVGKSIVNKAVSNEILPKEGVRKINGVPMAMKMIF